MAVERNYFKALARHFWALMSSAVFTFLGIYATGAGKSSEWVLWASAAAGLACFLYANYLAWKDQTDAALKLEADIAREQEKSMPKIMLRYTGIDDKYALHRAGASPEEMTELTAINCSDVDVFDVCIGRTKLGDFHLASAAPMDLLAKNSERKLIYAVINSVRGDVSLTHYAALNNLLDTLAAGESFKTEFEVQYRDYRGRFYNTTLELAHFPGMYGSPYFTILSTSIIQPVSTPSK